MKEQMKIQALMGAVRRMRSVDLYRYISDELSESEIVCLNTLCRLEKDNEHACLSEVIRYLNTHAASVSRTLKSLETKGLITRCQDPENHRNVLVSSTDQGRKINDMNLRRIETYWTNIIDLMPEKDIDDLISIMQRLSEIMEDTVKEVAL